MIFHSTHVCAQVAAFVLSHTTAPVRSKFCLQDHACEGARNLCATARPVSCTRTCPLSLSPLKKHDTKTLSRVRSSARDVTSQARSLTSIQAMAPRPLCNCSTFIAMSTKCTTLGTPPKHVASLGHVEKQDKCSSVFWSDIHSHTHT